MKNAIRISVEKPCSEKFENFNPTAAGGFCDSCQKEVIDFTAMTSKDIVAHFGITSSKTCGRFKPSQLKKYKPMIINKPQNNLVAKGLAVMSFSLLSLCAVSNMQAQEFASNEPIKEVTVLEEPFIMGEIAIQEFTISGVVIDEDNLPLAGVNVVLKGTKEGVVTDLDGKFEFPRTLEVDDVLIFSYVGYNPQEYKVVADASKNTDIKITFDLSNISLMGAVEVDGVYSSKKNVFQKFIGLFK